MTDMPTVEHGTYLVLRTDGTEEVHQPPTLDEMRRSIGAETLDTVILTWHARLRPDLVMPVDDHGYDTREVECGPITELVPVRALKPVNRHATELYWSICEPGTTHEIVGDVAICHDGDGRAKG